MRQILVVIGLLALLCGEALAADDIRSVVLADGTRVTGVVVSRDKDFLTLQDAEGRVHALRVWDIVDLREVPPDAWMAPAEPLDGGATPRIDVHRRSAHRALARDGLTLAVAPVVPLMSTGIVFTIMGGFGDSPPFLGAGIGLTANSFGAVIAGARIARRFSGEPGAGRRAFETGVVLGVIGLSLLDVSAVVAERAGDERDGQASGVAAMLAANAVGLVIAAHASIGSSAIQALEEEGFARGPAPPIPYASISAERAVFGVQGAW